MQLVIESGPVVAVRRNKLQVGVLMHFGTVSRAAREESLATGIHPLVLKIYCQVGNFLNCRYSLLVVKLAFYCAIIKSGLVHSK